jgi:LacI family fructose operon transcriptional repressor
MTIGIKDVARIAGVSPSSVSRALGNGPISDKVREHVLKVVKETGYRPNMAARRLRSNRTKTIGLIVADLGNPFFTAITQAVESAAYQAGMRVMFCNTGEDPEREEMYIKFMQEERVSGLILAPTTHGLKSLSKWSFDFPVVLIDRAREKEKLDVIVLDNQTATKELVIHLHSQGYQHIGGLFGATSITGEERKNGYIDAMHSLNLKPDIRSVPATADAAQKALEAWFTEPNRPEAVILSNSLFTRSALMAARATGLSIPNDIAIAGFDDEPWSSLVDPGITVIRQPVEVMGKEAVSALIQRLETPDAPVRRLVLSGECVVRGSSQKL